MDTSEFLELRCNRCDGHVKAKSTEVVTAADGTSIYIGADGQYTCESCGTGYVCGVRYGVRPYTGSGGGAVAVGKGAVAVASGGVYVKGHVGGSIITGSAVITGGDFYGGDKRK